MKRAKRCRDKKKKTENSNKNNTKKKIILSILLVVFIVAIVIAIVNIVKWNLENQSTEKILNEISEHITVDETKINSDIEKYNINFKELKDKNEDTVAWLKVLGTDIEYPIVKAKDNEYYLTHSYDGTYNTAGWPFADYKNKFDNTDKNIIVYGHNRRDGSMFGTLSDMYDEKWYENLENRKLIFATEQETNFYEIFSIYTVEAESYYITTSFSNNFGKFINDMKKRSERNFDVDVNENDKILTLSTCGAGNTRVVVHAKKIEN